MKRFLKALVTTTLIEAIGLHPIAAFAGTMLLMGVGVLATGAFNTPTITPQPSAFFTLSNASSNNVGLETNGGTVGALSLPSSDPQQSFAIYSEELLNPSWSGSSNWLMGTLSGSQILGLSVSASAAPVLSMQAQTGGGGVTNGYWWLPTGANNNLASNLTTTKLTNANLGYYAWQASTACPSANGAGAREPQGILNQTGSTGLVADPGFLCGATSPGGAGASVVMASIPGVAAQQTVTALTCLSNTPITGEFQVTATVPVSSGLEPGTSFSLSGFTPTGFNQSYSATVGTTGTTVVGYTNSTGTCPTTPPSVFGTLGNGTGGQVVFGAPSANPFQNNNVTTGIQLSPNQRACVLVGENGDDTDFPGSQYAYATKYDGTALPGASTPVVSPWLNMGAVSFNGYISPNAQSPTSPALTVTSMRSYAVTAATKATGQLYDVQFTIGASNPFVLGSEFTVSGVTPTAYNGTYVAVAPTSNTTPGTTIYGKLLTGSVGVPTAFVGSPGAITVSGTAVGVIMPGMEPLGTSPTFIMPYGAYGGTGTGGTGTYGLTGTQSLLSVTGSITGSVYTQSSALPGSRFITVGTFVTAPGATPPFSAVVTGFGTGSGGTGTYNLSASPTGTISSGISIGGPGDSVTPVSVNIYAANGFYYTLTPLTSGLPWGQIASRSSSAIGDLLNVIGSQRATTTNGAIASGWNGAIGNVGMYTGSPFPNTLGVPSTTAFNSLCQKSVDFQSFATSNGGAWTSLYRLNDPGIWADSSVAQFTGSISGTALTVSSTQSGSTSALAPSTVIAGQGITGCPSTCPTISSGSGSSYTLNTSGGTVSSEAMTAGTFKPAAPLQSIPLTGSIASGVLTVTSVAPSVAAWTATATSISATGLLLNFSSPTGTLGSGQCVVDSAGMISAAAPLCTTGAAGGSSVAINTNYLPTGYTFPGGDTLYAYQTRVVPGQWITDGGSHITSPAMVTGQLTQAACASNPTIPAVVLGECGTYALSTSANGTVSSETMFMSGVGAAGAIAPGAALTIDNPGLGVIYPITIASSPLVGSMQISGTFNASLLGGTPTAIQAQVSATPNGPALSGCSACAWTNLSSSSIGSGIWSGTVVNIPAGGPYWVSVRAANGTAYTTLPNSVGVGVNIATFGQGNTGWLTNTNPTVTFMSGLGQTNGYFPGQQTNGVTAVFGPPLVNNLAPFSPGQAAIDAYGRLFLGEGTSSIIQNANAVLRSAGITVPVGLSNMSRNGVGFNNQWWDNLPQTQTLAIGDGSSTVFSSGIGFGGSVGGNGTNNSLSSHTATLAAGGITTAGLMNINPPADSWNALAPGEAVSCSSGTGCPYAGTIVAAAPTFPSGSSTQLTGYGGAGTYIVSPAPGSAVAAGVTMTIKHNILGFNVALGYGAGITGTYSNPGGSSPTLTVNTITSGMQAIDPTMVVSDGSASSTLLGCTSGCTQAIPTGSTWALSDTHLSGDTSATAMTVLPAGGSPMAGVPLEFMSPLSAVMSLTANSGNGGGQIVKWGTFEVLLNGVVVCQDTTSTFSWQLDAAACTDAGAGVIDSAHSWVNYQYGTYSIKFAAGHTPASGAIITAQWTNCSTMNNDEAWNNICWVGNGKHQDGVYSSVAAGTGGINVWLNAQQTIDNGLALAVYQAKSYNYTFAQNFSRLHNGQQNMPMYVPGETKWDGSLQFYNQFTSQNFDTELYDDDAVTLSSFSGKISAAGGSSGAYTAILTENGAATGTMWEGELIECAPASVACASTSLAGAAGLPTASEIVGICTVALCGSASPSGWGTNGSTYLIANTGTTPFINTTGNINMENALYYSPGGAVYVGPANDGMMQLGVAPGGSSPEQTPGPFSSVRLGQREGIEIAAGVAGNPSLGSAPTVSRSLVSGCTGSATTSPCFDIGNTYAASHAATWSGSTFTISGGLSANARPFVPGMALSCSGCNSGLVALSVSLPPTESTATGAGQVGQTFTVTASGTIGGGGSGTLTGGCKGTAGVGSNCVDIGFDINTGGTYGGASAALNTCGVNNIVGSNSNGATTPPFITAALLYLPPNGACVPTGIGAFVWGFRIGTAAVNDGTLPCISATSNGTCTTSSSIFSNVGSSWPNGMDYGYQNGVILQNQAFTCNIVAAKVVQCVLGAQYNVPGQSAAPNPGSTSYGSSTMNGAFSSIGEWPTSGTFVTYGDGYSAGFIGGIMGNAGGQSFPFTAGSGYTVSTTSSGTSTSGFTTVGGLCPTLGFAGATQVITMGVAISGGAIKDVYPTNAGNATYGQCTFPTGYTIYGTISGASGGKATLTIASATVTASGASVPVGTGQTISITGGAGVGNLTLGSTLNGNTATFPLLITACPGTGCGTTGNYTVTNLNTAAQSGTSWTTAVTNGASTPPAQTGPLSPGAIITDGTQPSGSYATLLSQSAWSGYVGTYPIVCPTTCTNHAAEAITVGLQSGTGGVITTPPLSPLEGIGGTATVDTDNNKSGLYVCDNSAAVSGNPLWPLLNGGYSNGTTSTMTDPGMCAKPFGMHRGVQVTG